MKKLILLFFLITSLLFSINLFSQELTWERYTVNDGLVQSQAHTTFQDSRGFLWICTRVGVSRFDGIHFENFTEKNGLTGQWIREICEDSGQNIWFLSNHGLSCYNGDTMVSYPFPAKIKNDKNYGFKMQPLSSDSLFIYQLLKSGKLQGFCLSEGKYSLANEYETGIDNMASKFYYISNYDPLGNAHWFAIDHQALYTVKSGILKKSSHRFQNVQAILPNGDGKLYYLENGYLFYLENEQPRQLSHDPIPGMTRNELYRMAIDKEGNIIISEDYQRTAHLFKPPFYEKSILKIPLSNSLFFDREDNLWMGSETGLYKASTLSILNYLPDKEGMHENVWSVTEGKNGHMYFSSFHDGLQRLENGKFHQVKGFPRLPDGKPANLLMGSISDEEGNIFLTSNQFPMIKFDGKSFTPLPYFGKTASSFIIRQNKQNGDLLVGGQEYFYKYDKNMQVRRWPVHPGNGKSKTVTGLETDNMSRIWLGGFNGMSMLIGDSLIHLPTKEFPFEHGGNTLLRDHKDNMWIGNSKGLFFYDYQTFENMKHPLLDDFILSLIEVGDSTLFIGSIKRIYMLNLKRFYADGSLDVIAIGEDKGFQGIEPGQNGFYKDSQGYLWLPCTDRVVKIDPGLIRKNAEPPIVYITGVQVMGGDMNWRKVDHEQADSLRFHIKDDEKDLKFDFIGISLRHPQGVSYSSMLEGYDNGWSEPTHERSVVYTNLPPGEYRFMVKATNTDGVWSTNQTILSFSIVPALYQRLWFQILVILLLASLFFAIGAYVMHLRRKKQRHEVENERKISELRLLAIQNQMEPHFTYNALNTIAAAVLKEEKMVAYNYFVKLSHLMRTILQYNNQLITTLDEEIAFVSTFVQIQQFRFTDKFDFIVEVAGDVNTQTIIPKMCIQTFVENAIKHGLMSKPDKGQLKVSVFYEGEFLCIHVADNGIGQEKAQLLKTGGSSNGLKIMKGYFDHFNLLNTKKLEWQMEDLATFDKKSNGTAVYIRIPKGFVYSKK